LSQEKLDVYQEEADNKGTYTGQSDRFNLIERAGLTRKAESRRKAGASGTRGPMHGHAEYIQENFPRISSMGFAAQPPIQPSAVILDEQNSGQLHCDQNWSFHIKFQLKKTLDHEGGEEAVGQSGFGSGLFYHPFVLLSSVFCLV
jgi:hypothetical protein